MTPARLGSIAMGERRSTIRTEDDMATMPPAMWSTLPKELLWLIFARLPLPQLLRLRSAALAGKWATNLDAREFRLLGAQHHANMCAVLVPDDAFGTYSVGVHADGSTTWQILRLHAGQPTSIGSSADGGLVCYALSYVTGIANSLVILVVNPLTGDRRELRGHGVHPTGLRMMQLLLDRTADAPTSTRYRVLLLKEENDPPAARGTFGGVLYDSATGQWTSTEDSSGFYLIESAHLGFLTEVQMKVFQTRPATYDCATRALLHFCGDGPPWYSRKCIPYALVQDHLFILNKNENDPVYGLSEHRYNPHAPRDGGKWTKSTEHHFGPRDFFRVADSFCPRLLACRGFLLVVDDVFNSTDASVHCRMAWLCNLSTGGWLNLRAQEDDRIRSAPTLLCELHWDVVP